MDVPVNVLTEMPLYVKNLFDGHGKPYHVFHNLQHTQAVVRHAAEIADHYQLNDQERFVLQTAAWFHDTGYLMGEVANHEETGVVLMRLFLDEYNVEPHLQDEAAKCIMATKRTVQPITRLQQILCDADTYHLGTPDFEYLDKLVWQERELSTDTKVKDHTGQSLQFLQSHTYFTDYCRNLLTAGKEKNIALLKRKMQESHQ
jgi:predicted metal-dependent HD superfamily phosphohydrolase